MSFMVTTLYRFELTICLSAWYATIPRKSTKVVPTETPATACWLPPVNIVYDSTPRFKRNKASEGNQHIYVDPSIENWGKNKNSKSSGCLVVIASKLVLASPSALFAKTKNSTHRSIIGIYQSKIHILHCTVLCMPS